MTLNSIDGSVGTFYKPLFFEFPDDINAYYNIIYNVMLGKALKVSHLSDQLNVNMTEFYFPAGTWCEVNQQANEPCFTSAGESYLLATKAYQSYLHLREGYIVPLYNSTNF